MLEYAIETFKDSDDIFFLDIKIGDLRPADITVIYIDGLVNTQIVDDFIIRDLKNERLARNPKDIISNILSGGLSHIKVAEIIDADDLVKKVVDSYVVIYYEGRAAALEVKGADRRVISEVTSESVFKGSREGFVENSRRNTALIRSYLNSEKLCVKNVETKVKNQTSVSLVYLSDVVDNRVLSELTEKLSAMETDNILASGFFEEHISGKKIRLFPQFFYSERVDRICANITEGRIAVIINGVPLVYILPTVFSMFMQAAEDYSYNYLVASGIRCLRYLSMILALLIPAYYIAATTFSPEMIPRELAIAIIKSKEGVPFKIYLEVIFMLFAFELLIEAGIRMPNTIGQAVSIVGAIVIGEAAVSASFISPAVIVVVALSGIAGLTIPNNDLSNAIRLWRAALAILAVFLGFYGMISGIIFMGFSLSTMEMFSIPYLWPFVYEDENYLNKDTLIRLPIKRGKSFLSLLLVMVMLTFTGCGIIEETEISGLSIVQLLAIDENEEGEIVVSILSRDLEDKDEEESGEEEPKKLISGAGISFSSVERELQRMYEKKLFWGHVEYFIFGADVAADNIYKQISYFSNEPRFRMNANIYLFEGKASELISKSKEAGFYLPDYIEHFRNSPQLLSESSQMTLFDLVEKKTEPAFTIPRISMSEETPEIKGYGVIRDGDFCGYIEEDAAKGYNILTNRMDNLILDVDFRETIISLKQLKCKVKMTPVLTGGKLTRVKIDLETRSNILEIKSLGGNKISNYVTELSENQQRLLLSYIEAVILKMKEHKADIVGISRVYRRKFPEAYSLDNWDEVISALDYEINIKCDINRAYNDGEDG